MVEGWIEWRGGEMPVKTGTPVYVQLRFGKTTIARAGSGYATRWVHGGPQKGFDDIISYRLPILTSAQKRRGQ